MPLWCIEYLELRALQKQHMQIRYSDCPYFSKQEIKFFYERCPSSTRREVNILFIKDTRWRHREVYINRLVKIIPIFLCLLTLFPYFSTVASFSLTYCKSIWISSSIWVYILYWGLPWQVKLIYLHTFSHCSILHELNSQSYPKNSKSVKVIFRFYNMSAFRWNKQSHLFYF